MGIELRAPKFFERLINFALIIICIKLLQLHGLLSNFGLLMVFGWLFEVLVTIYCDMNVASRFSRLHDFLRILVLQSILSLWIILFLICMDI